MELFICFKSAKVLSASLNWFSLKSNSFKLSRLLKTVLFNLISRFFDKSSDLNDLSPEKIPSYRTLILLSVKVKCWRLGKHTFFMFKSNFDKNAGWNRAILQMTKRSQTRVIWFVVNRVKKNFIPQVKPPVKAPIIPQVKPSVIPPIKNLR